MKIADVWSTLHEAGFVGNNGKPAQTDAQLVPQLNAFANGQFSFMQQAEMTVARLNPRDVQTMAQDTLSMVNKSFGGKPSLALGFLQKVQGSSIGQFDFDQLVKGGEADKLIQLDRADPAGFAKVLSGSYGSVQALDSALQAATPGTAPAPAKPQTRVPAPRPMA